MRNKRIFVAMTSIILLVLLLASVGSQEEGAEDVDLGWYEVADWEIAFCSSWGGIFDEQQASAGESKAEKMSEYTSLRISAAIQAEITELEPGEYNISLGSRLFEVSWYVQPVAESINYEVDMYYANGLKTNIETTSATPYSGYQGYYAEQSDDEISHVVLNVPTEGIELEVPFIE